jgi:hypothetical protein
MTLNLAPYKVCHTYIILMACSTMGKKGAGKRGFMKRCNEQCDVRLEAEEGCTGLRTAKDNDDVQQHGAGSSPVRSNVMHGHMVCAVTRPSGSNPASEHNSLTEESVRKEHNPESRGHMQQRHKRVICVDWCCFWY